MKILVTGSAGFIGSAFVSRLLKNKLSVIGIDSLNNYYDVTLKLSRLNLFKTNKLYTHYSEDITNKNILDQIFNEHKPDIVVNLAAQAGVRYSLQNPEKYINSNIVGFSNLIECSKNYEAQHFVYASSSSVYGANRNLPFSTNQPTNHPVSLYAATKKANELIAHTYSHLYNIPTTGLRFFTVYGPWGRPDMAYFKFTKAIIENKTIDVYNDGLLSRDFTYIDDIVDGLLSVIKKPAHPSVTWNAKKPDPSTSNSPWQLYNIGNSSPVSLIDFIKTLEMLLGKKAKKNFLPMQLGDVHDTFADIKDIENDFNFKPKISFEEGMAKFVEWYKNFYKVIN
jgi:UDP-glucuronate 4-epimerase